MLKYLPYALQALAAILGIGLGLWLKSGSTPAHEAGTHDEVPHDVKDAHTKPEKKAKHAEKKVEQHAEKKDDKKNKKKSEKGGHGDGHGGKDDAAAYGFMKFSRQFVVPVLGQSGVASLVVLDINIEVPPAETETIYQREPQLRDAMLATLLQLSNDGAFSERLLEPDNLDHVRAELLASARALLGEEAQNVLILNITRQDV